MTERTDNAATATFGQTIQSAREGRGWSAAALGAEVGRSAATVRAWEQGRLLPDDAELTALASTLELDARDMVDLRGPLPPEPAEQDPSDQDPPRQPRPDQHSSDQHPESAPPEPETAAAGGVPESVPEPESPPRTDRPGGHPADEPRRPVEASGVAVPVMADPLPYETERPPEHAPSNGGIDLAGMASQAMAWVRDRWRRRRLLARAPTQVKSYIEDDRQATTYRIRIVLTGAALVVLLLILRWAWGQFAEALSTLIETLRAAI